LHMRARHPCGPMVASSKEEGLLRELVTLSRLGGISIQDRVRAANEAKEKLAAVQDESSRTGTLSASSRGTKTKFTKSKSTPALRQTSSSAPATRRGGGWNRGEDDELAPFKEKLACIIELGYSLDWSEKPFHRTALWEATWKNNLAIVRILAANGASIDVPDYQGRTPLHEAAFYGHMNLVKFFLEKGHRIDCADAFGQTPLFRATQAGRQEVVQMLVDNGAKTNLLDGDDVSVHHLAAFHGRPILADYLLCKGAMKNRYAIEDSTIKEGGSLKDKTKGKALICGAAMMLGGRGSVRSSNALPNVVHKPVKPI